MYTLVKLVSIPGVPGLSSPEYAPQHVPIITDAPRITVSNLYQ
jgi:hypothetical protein